MRFDLGIVENLDRREWKIVWNDARRFELLQNERNVPLVIDSMRVNYELVALRPGRCDTEDEADAFYCRATALKLGHNAQSMHYGVPVGLGAAATA